MVIAVVVVIVRSGLELENSLTETLSADLILPRRVIYHLVYESTKSNEIDETISQSRLPFKIKLISFLLVTKLLSSMKLNTMDHPYG